MKKLKLGDVCMLTEGGVTNLLITRESQLNALNSDVLEQLYQCFDEAGKDPNVKVIVISGKGNRAFAAGADLKEILGKYSTEALRSYYIAFNKLYAKMGTIPQPVVAKVNGYAFGGGFLLALAADLVVADEKSLFSQPEVNFCFTGGAALLPRLVGKHKAAEITMLGGSLTAQDACRLNLVNWVVRTEELEEMTAKIVSTLLKKDAFALAAIKKIIRYSLDAGLTQTNAYEDEMSAVCLTRPNLKDAISAFINK